MNRACLYAVVVIAVIAAACGGGGPSTEAPDATGGDDDAVDARPPRPRATHFETEAENHPVPPSGLAEGFGASASFGGVRFWTTFDLDGDGFLDIVQTGDTAVTQRVWDAGGAPHWKVFAGDRDGWAATATDWPVPSSGRADGFFATGVTGAGYEWVTVDLDGDDRRDLVHTMDPATSRVWDATGAPHWKVYRGTASGRFDPDAIAWPVADSGTTTGFATTHSESGTAQWILLDLTGDGRRDLVQTMDPVTGRVWDAASAPHWKVFASTGTGFALAPTLWSVPASGTTYGFRTTAMASGVEQWVTIDLDGDAALDLVQTADTATGTVWDAAGAPYWKLFRGGASGFAAAAESWRVPPSGLPDGFSSARSELDARRWAVIDLDGDGDLDLVQTGDTSHGARVWDATGAPYWKLFANDGDRFSPDLVRWSVPSGPTDGFWDIDSEAGNRYWFLADADRDGYQDLIHTMDPATYAVWDATGSSYWKVYRGRP